MPCLTYHNWQTFAAMTLPRCASESISDGLYLTPRQAQQFPKIVAVVREPIARCVSGFQFWLDQVSPKRAATWETWVDRLLAGDRSQFVWQPQTDLIALAPVQPTELWAFEDLSRFSNLRHFNASPARNPDMSYRRAELDAYYAADVALRRQTV